LKIHIDQFLDKGFILLLLNDFRLWIQNLRKVEYELADITHQHDMITDEHHFIDNQLNDFIENIIESTPAVFGENNSCKREDYTIEKIMMEAQNNRNEIQ